MMESMVLLHNVYETGATQHIEKILALSDKVRQYEPNINTTI
jgi:hypothetical protein